jgi:hypothetical protein
MISGTVSMPATLLAGVTGRVRSMTCMTLPGDVIGSPGWPALYGVAPFGAVLARPDGHIAWRVLEAPAAPAGPGAGTDTASILLAAVRAATQLPVAAAAR